MVLGYINKTEFHLLTTLKVILTNANQTMVAISCFHLKPILNMIFFLLHVFLS